MGVAMKIGWIVRRPEGRYVKIVDGHDNMDFWFWREVCRDGTLGRLEYGPGWADGEENEHFDYRAGRRALD